MLGQTNWWATGATSTSTVVGRYGVYLWYVSCNLSIGSPVRMTHLIISEDGAASRRERDRNWPFRISLLPTMHLDYNSLAEEDSEEDGILHQKLLRVATL